MEEYDPDVAPDPDEWLLLDEGDQIWLVEEYHRRERIRLPNAMVHAGMHTAIETQLAMEIVPVVDAMSRLRGEGLDRHDALHAIAAMLSEHMFKVMKAGGSEGDPNEAYHESLRNLTARTWRAYGRE
jgi:hypothetical protein